MFLAYPVLGVGPQNFPWNIAQFETAEDIQALGRSQGSVLAHSLWVELMADLGIVGMLCVAVLMWGAWSGLSKVIRRTTDVLERFPHAKEYRTLRAYAYGLQGGLLAVSVNGVFLSLLYYSHVWLVIAAANAVPFVLKRLDQQHAPIFAAQGAPEMASVGPERGRRARRFARR
jgi:O-antigen ligase